MMEPRPSLSVSLVGGRRAPEAKRGTQGSSSGPQAPRRSWPAQRAETYIVTSKPKRRSSYWGLVHFIRCLLHGWYKSRVAATAANASAFANLMPSDAPIHTPSPTDRDLGKTLGEGDWLEADEGHRIWWSEGGDPHGAPVLVVHGGPGGRTRPDTLAWWSGLPVRWIGFDQRGCGRSTPAGETKANTLEHLLQDMERLRAQVGVARWSLAAGSWGAFVALAYAARFPQHVHGLFLRSPFLGSDEELRHYLEPWEAWYDRGPASLADLGWSLRQVYQGRDDPAWHPDTGLPLSPGVVAGAFDRAQSEPGGVARSAARCSVSASSAWSEAAAAAWRIHAHYAATGWTVGHDAWGWAESALTTLQGPVALVHGTDDAVCPVSTTERLQALCPRAVCVRVAHGGHRLDAEPMAGALRAQARAWAMRL